MQTQYINEMLNLPELKNHQILSIDVVSGIMIGAVKG